MMKFDVDASDLQKWGKHLDQVQKETNPALARALNTYGHQTVRSWATGIAENAGLEPGAVMNLIVVREATAQRLEFEADASAVVTANPEWLRPWEERDQAAFEGDTLVKIETIGDESTCELCEDIAAKSPWTLREVRQMAEKWAHFHGADGPAVGERTNLIHPNCRCFYQPWTSTRRLQVFPAAGKGMPPQLMTARQLGQRVAGELQIAIKVIR